MGSTDWMGVCRRIVARHGELFAATRGSAARSVYEGRGEGGDMSLALDRRCEEVVFEELERELEGGPTAVAVSEERGEVLIGMGTPTVRVTIDPIDGSMNVRRMIPSHSLSIAVSSGEAMADVEFGYVYDFGAGEEFTARRGGGVQLDGETLAADAPDHGLEVVGVESAEPSWIGPTIAALTDSVYRLRVVGSIAITMSYVGAARFDGMLSARPCRSVDAAASQLIVREAGGAVDFGGYELDAAPLDLDARYTVAAVRDRSNLELVLSAQAAGPAVGGR